MNIALLSHNGNLEGAPIMLSILAKELQNHGHTCTVALAETGLLERRLDKHNIPHTVFHNLFKHPANYLNHYKPDLAIINTILGFRAVEECKKTGVPVIWIIHESDMIFLKRGVTHEHFAMADAIVFPSEYAKAQYKQFDTGNFHVIHNGIAIDHVTAFQNTHTKEDLRKQYNIPFDASVFLSVGTHHALKGFETIVDAGTQLIKKHPERNIHYIIAGSIPSAKEQAEADALLRKVWDSGTRNVMHMYADFPNIYDLFGLSDYYLCASALETFPITILEAMAFQLPIIATNVGGIPEQVSNKTECILVKPKDVSGLSHTMESFMLRPEMAAKMSETALEKCIRMFSSEHMGNAYAKLIHTMPALAKIAKSIDYPSLSIQESKEVSLIVRASKGETIRDAIDSAVALFPLYREMIVGISPDLPTDVMAYLRGIPRVKIIPGTNDREQAGDLHYRLLDLCTGTWIANIDDDDLWTFAPSLNAIEEDVGIVHGDHMYMNTYLSPANRRRYMRKKGRAVLDPKKANNINGSNWIMRNAAWKSISKQMTDRSFNHSDWRMYYYLIQSGWQSHYLQCMMGIAQRFSYDFPVGPNYEWCNAVKKIEKRQEKQHRYQQQDWNIVDYQCYNLPGSSAKCRGPEIDLQKPYFSCVGAAQTFGCLCEKPYPTLLSNHLQLPVLNLGIGGAGPSYFLKHTRMLSHINKGQFAIIQIMSGRSVSNSLFSTKNGALPLICNQDQKEMTPTEAYAWLFKTYDEAYIRNIIEETQHNWVQEYTSLLESISVPTILLWFSNRTPDLQVSYNSLSSIMGKYPHMITKSMVEDVAVFADTYVECVTEKDIPFTFANRFTGKPASVIRGSVSYSKETYYPSPAMHKDAASALLQRCQSMQHAHRQIHLHVT